MLRFLATVALVAVFLCVADPVPATGSRKRNGTRVRRVDAGVASSAWRSSIVSVAGTGLADGGSGVGRIEEVTWNAARTEVADERVNGRFEGGDSDCRQIKGDESQWPTGASVDTGMPREEAAGNRSVTTRWPRRYCGPAGATRLERQRRVE